MEQNAAKARREQKRGEGEAKARKMRRQAKALYSAKNFEAAVAPHRALWEGRALLLGDAASGTLTAACNLIRVLLKVNRKDEAETLCAAELEKSRSALGADDAVTKKLSKLLAKARK